MVLVVGEPVQPAGADVARDRADRERMDVAHGAVAVGLVQVADDHVRGIPRRVADIRAPGLGPRRRCSQQDD